MSKATPLLSNMRLGNYMRQCPGRFVTVAQRRAIRRGIANHIAYLNRRKAADGRGR